MLMNKSYVLYEQWLNTSISKYFMKYIIIDVVLKIKSNSTWSYVLNNTALGIIFSRTAWNIAPIDIGLVSFWNIRDLGTLLWRLLKLTARGAAGLPMYGCLLLNPVAYARILLLSEI